MMFYICYIAIIFTLIPTGQSLECYNCISKSSKECLDPLSYIDFKPQKCDSSKINELADQTKLIAQELGNAFGADFAPQRTDVFPSACQKVVTYVGNERVIIRSCAVSPDLETHCVDFMKQTRNQVIKECSICDTDGCNSSNNLAPLSILSLIFATIVTSFWTIFIN